MPPKLKIVAEVILMGGLKSIPVAGKAFEVIDAVRARHAMLAQGERLEEIDLRTSRMERRLRDLVEEEIRMTLQRLGEPALDGPTLTAEIRNLRSIQQHGWEPTLFEGLLRNSSHWNELKSRPQHYGRVLEAQAMIDPNGIHVLIDADPLRVLELTPFAFAALLAKQSRGVPGADIQATADIWAFPTSKALISSIGPTLVRIEPGSFLMGSTKAQIDQLMRLFPESKREWFEDERPQHRVNITRPYLLGIHQVTVGQFRRFVEESRHQTEAEKSGKGSFGWDEKRRAWEIDPAKNWRNPGFSQTDDHPVVCVSHNDAVAFCQWLSTKEKKEGRTYRLPWEAEWEYACRAGTNALFVISNDPEDLVKIGNVADVSAKQKFPDWNCVKGNDGFVYTAPVGSLAPNAWGLYDMIGNVWEWCADWYDGKYYASSPAADPPGAPGASYRVFRGGCWSDNARVCRPAYRYGNAPGYRLYDLGFRVAAVQG